MASETVVNLTPQFFAERERILVQHDSLSASTFLFESGVCGLRLANGLGHLVLLPFQGQQIWSVEFGGRNLTMKSMFIEPRPTQVYLETYGGFLIHCGATAMGVPSSGDTHSLHGELPNAAYQKAHVVAGEDESGAYIGVGGQYQHTVAFNHNYVAQPQVKLYAGSTLFELAMTIINLKHSEMEVMYLAHVNFRPVENGRLVYSANCTPAMWNSWTSWPATPKSTTCWCRVCCSIQRSSFTSTIWPIKTAGPTRCRSGPTAVPTISATVRTSWTRASAGSP